MCATIHTRVDIKSYTMSSLYHSTPVVLSSSSSFLISLLHPLSFSPLTLSLSLRFIYPSPPSLLSFSLPPALPSAHLAFFFAAPPDSSLDINRSPSSSPLQHSLVPHLFHSLFFSSHPRLAGHTSPLPRRPAPSHSPSLKSLQRV